MRTIGLCLLGVLAVAPCQPHSRKVIPFKDALNYVPALHNLNIMAQYRSQNPKRIANMAEYLNWFHRMKDTLLEIGVSSVRYGASGAPKNAGPRPNSLPRPAERPGAGRVILWFPAPAPGPGRSPDRSPLKQVGRNGAPSKECAGTRPGWWRGGDHPQNNPPGPF